MNIQLKEMILKFTVVDDKLTRTITDMNGNVIWESVTEEATQVDISEEGIDAYETQMKMLPHWNIVSVEKNINGTITLS